MQNSDLNTEIFFFFFFYNISFVMFYALLPCRCRYVGKLDIYHIKYQFSYVFISFFSTFFNWLWKKYIYLHNICTYFGSCVLCWCLDLGLVSFLVVAIARNDSTLCLCYHCHGTIVFVCNVKLIVFMFHF